MCGALVACGVRVRRAAGMCGRFAGDKRAVLRAVLRSCAYIHPRRADFSGGVAPMGAIVKTSILASVLNCPPFGGGCALVVREAVDSSGGAPANVVFLSFMEEEPPPNALLSSMEEETWARAGAPLWCSTVDNRRVIHIRGQWLWITWSGRPQPIHMSTIFPKPVAAAVARMRQ